MTSYIDDVHELHTKFGFHESMKSLSPELMREYLNFRIRFLQEELDEIKKGAAEGNLEEIVDGLVDLMVVSQGTLDIFEINSHLAWKRVHIANMSKEKGIKEGRPNPFGLPDLCKPLGFKSPYHHDNVGLLKKAYE